MRALLAAAALLAAQHAFGEAGRTGGVTLSRPIGARPIAMAEAFSAVAGGLDSLTYNPAGLARLARPEVQSVYTHGIVDDHFSFLGAAVPHEAFTFAAGGAYYDAGTINLNLSSGVQERRKTQQDMVGMAAVAVALPSGLAVGATAKYYRFELAQEARASGAALDAGALWNTPLRGVSLGAAVQNAGPAVKYEQEGDPLPLTLRAGAAYLLDLGGIDSLKEAAVAFSRFLVTAEVVKPRDEKITPATGLEMRMPLGPDGYGALRFGYAFNRDLDSLSLGIGLKEGRFLLDYALGVKRAIGNTHHFALGVRL